MIQFKAKEIKHGKTTRTPDVVTASKERSCSDGREGKGLWHSFELQRNKALKKKREKAELKLKLKAEQAMVEKLKSFVYEVPHKKAESSKKRSEDVRIPKKPPDRSAGTGHGDRPVSKEPSALSSFWEEEEEEEEYKDFAEKKRHMSKHRSSHSPSETPPQRDSRKHKKHRPGSPKAPEHSGTKEGDLEATVLCFKQVIRTPFFVLCRCFRMAS